MGWLSWLLGRDEVPPSTAVNSGSACTFVEGDRVHDVFGKPGTVVGVDPNAEHGMGLIRVKLDDGRDLTFACIASGLTKIESPPSEPN